MKIYINGEVATHYSQQCVNDCYPMNAIILVKMVNGIMCFQLDYYITFFILYA